MGRLSRHRQNFRRRHLSLAMAACFATAPALALPTGAEVTAGAVNISRSGATLNITNTSGSIIQWQGFSIGAGETVRFLQPSATSSVLNRVVGSDPSTLLGTLQSNGQVFLINPAGILVGPGARVDVARFVASSLQLSDADFLARRFIFQATPGAGLVRNEGTITTPSGGSVYLVAPKVENAGLITTPGGETLLAAGRTVEIGDTGTPGVRVEFTGTDTQATNLGTVVSEAGRVGLVGALVKNSGSLNASSAVAEGGRIFLRAGTTLEQTTSGSIAANGAQGGAIRLESGDVALVDGKIDAVGGTGKGGDIAVLGDKVGIVGNAALDASGTSGGGTLLVGGDFQGKNPEIRNATVTFVGENTALRADATAAGNGGKVVVWADDTTRAYGQISARGGALGGDGGLAEVSGKRYLEFRATADLRAPTGRTGTLLLDPTDITIVASTGGSPGGTFASNVFSGNAAVSNLGWDDISAQLALGNLVISTASGFGGNGDINIAASPAGLPAGSAVISHIDAHGGTWSQDYSNIAYSSPNTLNFLAQRNISVSAPFANAGGGAIKLVAGWDGISTTAPVVTAGTGNINIYSAGPVVVANTTGNVSLNAGNNVSILGGVGMGGTNVIAGIDMGSGTLNITANNIYLRAGVASGYSNFYNRAFIASNGNQVFNVTGGQLLLQGGSSNAGDYGNAAEIAVFGSGSQTINMAPGSSLLVQGGTASGDDLGATFSGCPVSGGVFCSNNHAEIRAEGSGNQTIAFAGAGTLSVLGGSSDPVSGNNFAEITHNGTGAQVISGNAAILVQSGSGSGGFFFGGRNFENGAGISSNGTQVIQGSSLSLDASNSSGLGNAFLGGANQNISISGNITLSGGNSNQVAEDGIAAGAAIGNKGPVQSTIVAGGNFTMNAGSGSTSGAFVGSPDGNANVSITASGIQLNGSAAAPAAIGNLSGLASANITLATTGASGLQLNANSKLGAGPGTVVLTQSAPGPLTQSTTTQLIANTLMVNAQSGINLAGLDNRVGNVWLQTASGSIQYVSNAPTAHIVQAVVGSSGNIALSTGPSGANLALGNITVPTSNSVSVSAANTILDDNGDGAANISAGNIALNSTSGNAMGIAISADIVSGGSVSASVPAGGGNGGIRIHSLGPSAPTAMALSDLSLSGIGNIYFKHDGSLTAGGGYSLASSTGIVIMETAGDLTVSGASLTSPTGTVLSSGNNLSINSTLVPGGKLSLSALNTLAVNGTVNNAGSGEILVKAPAVSIASGGALKSNAIYMTTSTLNLGGELSGDNLADVIADQIVIDGGTLKSTYGNVVVDVTGDLRMTGGTISAGNEVSLALDGATSTLYLNEFAGSPAARIVSGTYNTLGPLRIDLTARSDGGIVIDGVVAGGTTGYTSANGSGFFNDSTPAVLGSGLILTYGVPLAGVPINDLLPTWTETSGTTTSTATGTSETPSTSVVTATVFSESGTTSGTTTAGGSEPRADEFGGGSTTTTGESKDEQKTSTQRRARVCR